eukprot:gene5373-3868_t
MHPPMAIECRHWRLREACEAKEACLSGQRHSQEREENRKHVELRSPFYYTSWHRRDCTLTSDTRRPA